MGQPNDLTDQTKKVVYRSLSPLTGTTTEAFDVAGGTLVGLITPGTVASTSVEIQVSDTISGTFVPVYDNAGNKYTITVAASRAFWINDSVTKPWKFAKLVFGSSETAAVFKLAIRTLS